MKRPYLDSLGHNVLRWDKVERGLKYKIYYWKEKMKTGIDPREMWSLDLAFYCWLYERIMMFLEDDNPIDLEYGKYDIHGEMLTQKEVLERLADGLRALLTDDDAFDYSAENVEELMYLWGKVLPAMWT